MTMSTIAGTVIPPRSVHLLREDRVDLATPRPAFEDEGSDRVARGSVTLPSEGRWEGVLEVRMRSTQGALLTVQRVGPGAGPAPTEATLVIPPGEEEAFLTLLTGLVAQARIFGVLAPTAEGKPLTRTRPQPKPGSTNPSS